MINKLSLRLVVYIFGIVVLVLVGAWLGRRLLSVYYQVRGGRLLEQVLQTAVEDGRTAIPCTLDPVTDVAVRMQLVQAVQLLIRSSYYNPQLSQTYLLLGRAECLLGEFEKAVEAYGQYTNLRPKNPLGHLELLALDLYCYEQSELANSKSVCPPKAYLKRAKGEWRHTRLATSILIENGDSSFAHANYKVAARYYRFGYQMGASMNAPTLHRWVAAAIASGQPIPGPVDVSEFPIYQLQDELLIVGNQLHWMQEINSSAPFGTPLSKFPGLVPSEGVMWWEGVAAVAVQIQCQADYTILFRAKHFALTGMSGSVDIEADFKTVAKFTLGPSWQDLSTRLVLQTGPHLISIRYLQDVGDAIIQQVRLTRDSTCIGSAIPTIVMASNTNEAKP